MASSTSSGPGTVVDEPPVSMDNQDYYAILGVSRSVRDLVSSVGPSFLFALSVLALPLSCAPLSVSDSVFVALCVV